MRKQLTRAVRYLKQGAWVGIFLFLLSSCAVSAQETPDNALKDIELSIARGDAGGLVERSSENVEIAILGSGTLFSRSQAQYVLQEFFREHPPEQFAFSQPTRSSASLFASGNYFARSSDRLFHVFVRMRIRDGLWEAREIRIERRDRGEQR